VRTLIVPLRATLAVAVLVLVGWAPAAPAAPGLIVGVTDDGFLWRGPSAVSAAGELGLTAVRVTVPWTPGRSQLSDADSARLDAVLPAAAAGLRVVVTVFGKAAAAPQDDAARDAYCGYIRDLLARYPIVDDVVIWNEANLSFYWQPQFASNGVSVAPAAYERLLARCWDVLHAFRPNVNVLMTTSPAGNDDPNAAGNVSHSPGMFIRKMGAAYRASGRTKPIFDTVGHNPYGMSSAESPWRQHFTPSHIGEADVDRLVEALDDGFGGTAQPVPGRCAGAGRTCPSIWYLETGYQTAPDPAHRPLYAGRENDAHPVPDGGASGGGPTQSTQLAEGIELAYCQPYVGAIFNFLLWDEPDLARWQSGVFWADGSEKASFDALQQAVGEVRNGKVDCRRLRATHASPAQPAGDRLVERIEWPELSSYSVYNAVWGLAIEARADVTFRATLRRQGRCDASGVARCRLVSTGTLRRGRPASVSFPAERLVPGSYRIEITLMRTRPRPLVVTRRSPAFVVE
jgi:hypothetical protein